MKKFFSILLATCLFVTPCFANVQTDLVYNKDGIISTEFGVGRLVSTMNKTQRYDIEIVDVKDYAGKPGAMSIKLDAGSNWITGNWIVYPVAENTIDEQFLASNGMYWFNLYDQQYHKRGTMVAQKYYQYLIQNGLQAEAEN